MIYFDVYQRSCIDKVAGAKTMEGISKFVVKGIRKSLGKQIKKYIEFGIKPKGKLRISSKETLLNYDYKFIRGKIPMQGDFFSVLHAYRAGFYIDRGVV